MKAALLTAAAAAAASILPSATTVVVVVAAAGAPAPPPPPPSAEFDCAARSFALELALKRTLAPWPPAAASAAGRRVYDALRLRECDGAGDYEELVRSFAPRKEEGGPRPPPTSQQQQRVWRRRRRTSTTTTTTTVKQQQRPSASATTIFVDPATGDDSAPGTTAERPLRTLRAARDAARRALGRSESASDSAAAAAENNANNANNATIVLRGGRYHLEDTLVLDSRDDGLTIRAYGNERPVLSGGDPLRLALRPTADDPRIYSADLSEQVKVGPDRGFNFTLLFLVDNSKTNEDEAKADDDDDVRLVWAREPNGHPERDLQPTGYARASGPGTASQWPDPAGSVHLAVTEPRRNSTFYPVFGQDLDPRGGGSWLHVGGYGDRFVGRRGFWNGTVPTGLRYDDGGSERDGKERTTKFDASGWTSRGYAGAVAHVFHSSLWGNWQFRVGSVNATARQIDFDPSGGGWQEGRGGGMNTQPFFVEGVREALDVPGEWWLDREGQVLYYYPFGNETAAEADRSEINVEFVAPRLKRLVAVTGTSERSPAVGVALRGLTFAHSATTFLDPYEVPSPGDWSIRRDGALFVENADDLTVDLCRFVRTGGNAVFLSGRVKRAGITRSEFAWTGDSAVATVGRLAMADGFTVDAYPEDTLVAHNHFREVGVHGKQTSALFSALSCRTRFVSNVAYNGPRAGVNLNDQFCHGHQIEDNTLFNWVRETQDHGPINTWDRAMYLQRNPQTGEPTVVPQWTHIAHNFIMNGPSGNRDLGNLFPAIDNDDGSSYFLVSENFMVYGGAKNYLGHDKIWARNVFAYPGRWSNDPCAMLWAGKNHRFEGNRCIVGRGQDPIGLDGTTKGFDCVIDWDDADELEFVGRTANNTYYLDSEDSWGFGCGNGTDPNHRFTISEMQSHGWEVGSSVLEAKSLTPDAIIVLGREILNQT